MSAPQNQPINQAFAPEDPTVRPRPPKLRCPAKVLLRISESLPSRRENASAHYSSSPDSANLRVFDLESKPSLGVYASCSSRPSQTTSRLQVSQIDPSPRLIFFFSSSRASFSAAFFEASAW